MNFYSVLSTFFSAPAFAVLHNSYCMPLLAATTHTFCAAHHFFSIRFLEQSYVATRYKSSLQKFNGRHQELMDRYSVFICIMKTDLFKVSKYSLLLPSTTDFPFKRNSTDVCRKAEDSLPVHLVHVRSFCSFSCFFVCTILVLLYFFSILCSLLCLPVFPV